MFGKYLPPAKSLCNRTDSPDPETPTGKPVGRLRSGDIGGDSQPLPRHTRHTRRFPPRSLELSSAAHEIALHTRELALHTRELALRTPHLALHTLRLALRARGLALRAFGLATRASEFALRARELALPTGGIALRSGTLALPTPKAAQQTRQVLLRLGQSAKRKRRAAAPSGHLASGEPDALEDLVQRRGEAFEAGRTEGPSDQPSHARQTGVLHRDDSLVG
jgi:hypothetical protein